MWTIMVNIESDIFKADGLEEGGQRSLSFCLISSASPSWLLAGLAFSESTWRPRHFKDTPRSIFTADERFLWIPIQQQSDYCTIYRAQGFSWTVTLIWDYNQTFFQLWNIPQCTPTERLFSDVMAKIRSSALIEYWTKHNESTSFKESVAKNVLLVMMQDKWQK